MTFNFATQPPPTGGLFGAQSSASQPFSFTAPPPPVQQQQQAAGVNFGTGFGQQAQTAPPTTAGLGGTSNQSSTSAGNNADLSGASAATGSARLIEKPRDVQLPAELLAQFNALKAHLHKHRCLLDALAALDNDATQSSNAHSAIDDLLRETAVCRAQMHICGERVGVLRARALDEWRAAEAMHRHIVSGAAGATNAFATVDYLLRAADQHSTMLTVYGEQVVALEQLITAKLTRNVDDKPSSLATIVEQLEQFNAIFQDYKRMVDENHEQVQTMQFHVRRHHQQMHGDLGSGLGELFVDSDEENDASIESSHRDTLATGPDQFATPSHTLLMQMAQRVNAAAGVQQQPLAAAQGTAAGMFSFAQPTANKSMFGGPSQTGFSFGTSTAPTTTSGSGGLFGGTAPKQTFNNTSFGNTSAGTLFGGSNK